MVTPHSPRRDVASAWWPLRVQLPVTRVLLVVLYFALSTAASFMWQGTLLGALVWLGIEVGFWVLVVRAFRSTREAREPARPWWRCTFTAVASWWLAVYMLFGAVATVIGWSDGARTATDVVAFFAEAAVMLAFCTCAAVLFAISGYRLTWAEKAVGTREPVHWKGNAG